MFKVSACVYICGGEVCVWYVCVCACVILILFVISNVKMKSSPICMHMHDACNIQYRKSALICIPFQCKLEQVML